MKRTRYTFTAYNPRLGATVSSEILAYSAESVERYARGSGYTNVLIDRARRRPRRGASQAAAWTVDARALAEAKRTLGVTWNVRVTRTASRSHAGCYRPSSSTFAHRVHNITVDKLATPEKATEILLHELTHAAQAERERSWGNYLIAWRQQKRYSYARRPWEVEARAEAAKYAGSIRVAVSDS